MTIQFDADVSNTADAREWCTNVFIFALGRFMGCFRVTWSRRVFRFQTRWSVIDCSARTSAFVVFLRVSGCCRLHVFASQQQKLIQTNHSLRMIISNQLLKAEMFVINYYKQRKLDSDWKTARRRCTCQCVACKAALGFSWACRTKRPRDECCSSPSPNLCTPPKACQTGSPCLLTSQLGQKFCNNILGQIKNSPHLRKNDTWLTVAF